MRKYLHRLALATSLLLLPAAIAGWVRGQWATDRFYRNRVVGDGNVVTLRTLQLMLYRGSLGLSSCEIEMQPRSSVAADRFRNAVRVRFGLRHAEAPPSRHQYRSVPEADAQRGAARWGFGWEWITLANKGSYYDPDEGPTTARVRRFTALNLAVPWWFLLLLASVIPARTVWKLRRGRQRLPHLCRYCGYDLRATPDATGALLPICPECGRASRARVQASQLPMNAK